MKGADMKKIANSIKGFFLCIWDGIRFLRILWGESNER